METKEHLKLTWKPKLQSSSLVVAWSLDAGKLGVKVINYVNKKLGGKSFCEIEPVEFFPLGGVIVQDDLVQFPENKFYAYANKDVVFFHGTPPSYEWYKFLNLILDVAEHYCNVKELYAIGSMVFLGAHTTPRELLSTFNTPDLKKVLSPYNFGGERDYETPPGQRPTLNSFLSWTAKRRNIPGVSIWVPIPFYLTAVDDPEACRKVLEFFDQRFNLGINFSDLDEEIRQHNQMLAKMRIDFPDIDESISKLESNLRLSEGESKRLIEETEKYLSGERS